MRYSLKATMTLAVAEAIVQRREVSWLYYSDATMVASYAVVRKAGAA